MAFAGPINPTHCEEHVRLLAILNDATEEYAIEAQRLAKSMGVLAEPAYRIMRADVEMAWQKAEVAREALMRHRQEHGC